VVNYVSVPSATTAFNSYLDAVFANNPQLLYLVTESEQAAAFTNQAQIYLNSNPSINMPQVLGCDGNYSSDKFLPTADINFSNGMVGANPSTKTVNPNYIAFIAAYTAKYGNPPTASYVSQAYDAIYLLAYAMLKSGETITNSQDNKVIAQGIAQNMRIVSGGDQSVQGVEVYVNSFTQAKLILPLGNINYQGASGDVDFDANGDVMSGYYLIWQVGLSGQNLIYSNRTFMQYP